MIKKMSDILPDFEYFMASRKDDMSGLRPAIKGDNPTLLIHCGTHGDEFESIDIVKECVEKYEDKLPDFVFVPVVSPSAVKNKTRLNENGFDLNRIFFSDSKEPEVVENIKVLNGYKFDLFVSFHEDFEYLDYYVYDEGFIHNKADKVINHNKKLEKLDINLFNGIDDPILKTEIINGYKKFTPARNLKNNGMITSWLLSEKKVINTLTPEIPMKLNSALKEKIINTFFEDILCII